MSAVINDTADIANQASPALQNRLISSRAVNDRNRDIKQGIWLYFLLLIFEGALRKWVLPGLATPLLLVRDPIALWLLVTAISRGLLPSTPYLTAMVVIGIAGIITAIFMGHGNLVVALFGSRILLLHFPLIFVIGRVFNRDDVLKVGKATLWLSLPMTILIALQFYSPQSAWVNRGVGGDIAGSGFSGALGFFRPPGTFSFTNGTSLFYSFAGCFIIYFWLAGKSKNVLLIAATIGLVAAIPLSISRGLFFQIAGSLLFVLMATFRNPKYLGRTLLGGVGVILAFIFLSNSEFFQTATEAFFYRFNTANEVEGGVKGVFVDRFLGGMIGALSGSGNLPFFGFGLGMGTNVGSMLLAGESVYLISEGEWGRLIGEMGPLMGIVVIFIRIGVVAKIALASYHKLQFGDLLPWMLLSFGLLTVSQSQWGQPTALGFSVMIGGLMIASLKKPVTTFKPVRQGAQRESN